MKGEDLALLEGDLVPPPGVGHYHLAGHVPPVLYGQCAVDSVPRRWSAQAVASVIWLVTERVMYSVTDIVTDNVT